MDMFIKFTPELKGESKDKAHGKEIDVLAWSWGMSQSGTMHTGGGGGSGKVNVQDLSLTKYVDKSSPELMRIAGKRSFDTATSVRCRLGVPTLRRRDRQSVRQMEGERDGAHTRGDAGMRRCGNATRICQSERSECAVIPSERSESRDLHLVSRGDAGNCPSTRRATQAKGPFCRTIKTWLGRGWI